ncbi:MAG: glycine cleavage system aminomethyltransferase GcvT [Pseudomonadota bacterium]
MSLKRTPFFEFHVAAGGKLIDFGGWELPVQFEGIIKEHLLVRSGVGLFDVSHMGEVRCTGPEALQAVQGLVTNDVGSLAIGQALYSPMCNHQGGIVDDLLVYRVGESELFLVVNAANTEKDFAWMVANNPRPQGASFVNESAAWGQLAVQGRHAEAVLQQLVQVDLSQVAYYHFVQATVAGVPGCIVSRTGYTAEDGFEIYLPASGAQALWPAVMQAGAAFGIAPIGLGARDTLRLEGKMALYGNDIDDTTTPLDAALAWTVKFDKPVRFIGQDVLEAQRDAKPTRRLVCLEVEGRIARQHMPILSGGQVVGEITSGTRSPTLEKNIALGYVPIALAKPGSEVEIDVRGRIAPARVVKPPFFKRDY